MLFRYALFNLCDDEFTRFYLFFYFVCELFGYRFAVLFILVNRLERGVIFCVILQEGVHYPVAVGLERGNFALPVND